MEILPKFWHSRLLRKTISLLVIQSFVFSNITFAESLQNKLDIPERNQSVVNPDNIIIEKDHGLIKSKFLGNSNKLVIHIQDAHCNYEAQTNIVNILETLIKNQNLSLISVEGADGLIDTTWFKAFPDEEVRKEVAAYFMKKGEITGPEFLSITKNYPVKLFGAEDRAAYIQNLNAFTSSYALKADTEKYYNSIKNALNRLKGYIYNSELKAMDAKSEDYESKKIQFNDYVRFLQETAERHKVNLRSYENFFRLVSVLIYEKKIDFSLTDKERNGLIDELSKCISKDALTELVSQSLSFKSGKISSVEFYGYLKKIAGANNIDLAKKYPNLYNYIIYNSVYFRIENDKLFHEIKKIETDIKEKLYTNDDQRVLEKLSRHIDILLGMVNIKLLNGDFSYYQTHRDEFSHEAFTDFIKKKGEQYGLAYDVEPPTEAVAKSIPKLEDFYTIAMRRDKALVDNTLKEMDREKQQIAVLITGGFHSEGMAKLLEKQGISYIVVCPSITKDVPTPYIQILTNQRTPLEDILTSPDAAKKGMLAPISMAELVPMTSGDIRRFLLHAPDELLNSIIDRTEVLRKGWARAGMAKWLAQAMRATINHNYARDEKFMKDAYIYAMNVGLKKYFVENGKRESEAAIIAGKIVDTIVKTEDFNRAFAATFARMAPVAEKLASTPTSYIRTDSVVKQGEKLISGKDAKSLILAKCNFPRYTGNPDDYRVIQLSDGRYYILEVNSGTSGYLDTVGNFSVNGGGTQANGAGATTLTDILTPQQWRLLDEAAEIYNLNEPYKLYLAQMWAQHLLRQARQDETKPLRIAADPANIEPEENFILTALLTEDQNRKREHDHRDLKKDPENAKAARKAIVILNSLDAGRGENFVRVERLAKRLGIPVKDVKLTAKGTDVGFDIACEGTPEFISIAEARLLQLVIFAETFAKAKQKPYAGVFFQPIVNWESKEPYENLMDKVCLIDKLDPNRKDKRTYRQALERDGKGIKLPDPKMIEQADLPGINIATNMIATGLDGLHQPGGHGQLGFMFLYNCLVTPVASDANVRIRFFFNGDNVNAHADPSIVGAMVRYGWPIVKVTTIAAPIDKKGGKDGERIDRAGGASTPDMMELADAQDAEKKQPGQLKEFIGSGQAGGLGTQGEQRFNTNLIYINETVLNSIFRELLDSKIITKEKLCEIISPLLIAKKAKLAKDGQSYYPIDGAIGVAVHHLNAFFIKSTDPRVKEVLAAHGIDRILHLVNIPLSERTATFAPIKKAYDTLLLAHSDYCRFNTKRFILEDSEAGLTPPEFDFSDPVLPDKDTGWWEEEQHVIDALAGAHLRQLHSLQVKGKVMLPNSTFVGTVIIENKSGTIIGLNEKLARLKQNGRLVLKNMTITINSDGTIETKPIEDVGAIRGNGTGEHGGAIISKLGELPIGFEWVTGHEGKICRKIALTGQPVNTVEYMQNSDGTWSAFAGGLPAEHQQVADHVLLMQDRLQKAINGDEAAYKAILAVPKEELMAYFESNLNETIANLPEDIFGFGNGYDVRGNAQPIKGGIVNLTPANLYLIGKLMGTHYANSGDKALITGDIRNHTSILRYVMALGAASVGVNVEYAPDYLTTGAHNLLSTENVGNYKFMIQVSGSHGVPEKNGFKIKACLDNRRDSSGRMILDPLYAERLAKLYQERSVVRQNAKLGELKEVSGLEKYVIDMLNRKLPAITKDEIVVIDPRAGAAGPIATGLLEKRGFTIIDMDNYTDAQMISKIKEIWRAGKVGSRRIAVMLNMKPDANMGRGIWDPSKPEALKDTQRLVNLINKNLIEDMPKAIGSVFDGDADRITGILEDGTGVPAFEMTLPYYQRFLVDERNQEVMARIAKAGGKPIEIVCDVRANSKLLGLIDRVNKQLQDRTGIKDRNIVEGWFITTGYPPQLGFMQNRIKELEDFVASSAELKNDEEFMKKFANFKATYFTAEASGHNFFHISESYPDRVCDCAIAGFVTLLNIRETMLSAEVPAGKPTLHLTDLFSNFPVAYSSNEVRVPIPNAIKLSTAREVGKWMKEKYEAELKPYTEPIKEGDYLKQPKDAGYVTVSGFKIQLKDGRSALVRWSNTGEELTTIFEGRDWASLISIMKEITERLRQEAGKGVNVANLDNEIKRIGIVMETENAAFLATKLHTPLVATTNKPDAFMKAGYNKDGTQTGYGVPEGAAIDGSFAIGQEGNQGYYVEGGQKIFLDTVQSMKEFFQRRADRLGHPIRYVIKPGIGGQHTPFQGIADIFQLIDLTTGKVVGEYELGKNYEEALAATLKELGADWDQIAVIPSSKSGATDETMMIFSEVFYILLKNIAAKEGLNGETFANTVFNTMHEVNFENGVERPMKLKEDEAKRPLLFEGFSLKLVESKLAAQGLKVTDKQLKDIFGIVLGNMFFETTNRPEESRLSAFINNSNLGEELGIDKPGFGAMFDNVGGRWTADLHMMTFLAYHGFSEEEIAAYWNARYKGITEVREGKHLGSQLGNKILNEGITDIALVVPDEFFWFGKAMEQNFNESIWQKGFANLVAIKQSTWDAQKKHYASNPNRMVINLSTLSEAAIPAKTFNVVKVEAPDIQKLNKQELANAMGGLFTTFYGMTHTVGNRLIVRALASKGYTLADVDLNDLNNSATRIVQQNLYVRQPYVELGKGLLEAKLKALQAEGPRAIEREFANIQQAARDKRIESNVPEFNLPENTNIGSMEQLANVIDRAVKLAQKENRKFVPFIYLEGSKFQELRNYLTRLGIEWVLQGTGDQHISYQQVLAQPQKYLPFIVSFVPSENPLPGRPAVGFAKGYLHNVSPHMVRDLFAKASYDALTQPRRNEAGEEVKGAAGIFMRLADSEGNRAMLGRSFANAMAVDLSCYSGLPVTLNKETAELTFWETVVSEPKWVRTLKVAGDSIANPDIIKKSNPKEVVYYGYRNVVAKQDAGKVDDQHLRFDITVLLPGFIGEEFIMTKGHEHPKKVVGGQVLPAKKYPEFYEVWSGYALYVQQGTNPVTNKFEVEVTFAKPGDKVLLKTGYSHRTVNIGNEPLVMANWISEEVGGKLARVEGEARYDVDKKVDVAVTPTVKPNFSEIEENNGYAYYVMRSSGGGIQFVFNENYAPTSKKGLQYGPRTAELNFATPVSEIPQLNLSDKEPMYSQAGNKALSYFLGGWPNPELERSSSTPETVESFAKKVQQSLPGVSVAGVKPVSEPVAKNREAVGHVTYEGPNSLFETSLIAKPAEPKVEQAKVLPAGISPDNIEWVPGRVNRTFRIKGTTIEWQRNERTGEWMKQPFSGALPAGYENGEAESQETPIDEFVNKIVTEEVAKSPLTGPNSKQIIFEMKREGTDLHSVIIEVSKRKIAGEKVKQVVLLRDVDLYPTDVAHAADDVVKKYLGDTLIDVPGRGKALLENGRAEIANLIAEGKVEGKDFVVVTLTGNKTLAAIAGIKESGLSQESLKDNKEVKELGRVLNIQTGEGLYPPIIGLYSVALRLAYDSDNNILRCLNSIAWNGKPNQPFTLADLARGVLVILPKMGPVNLSEAVEAYNIAKQVLQAL